MDYYYWIIAFVLFSVLEAATVGLVSVWFAVGSIAGLIVNICNGSVTFQVIAFVVVSLIMLIMTRPFAKKMLSKDRTPTNADRYLGMTGIVIEAVDEIAGTGLILVKGRHWSARSDDGSVIPEGMKVNIMRIEGVKVIVEAVLETANI